MLVKHCLDALIGPTTTFTTRLVLLRLSCLELVPRAVLAAR